MQAPISTHPSDKALRAFGNGQLDPASAESVSTHLDECEDCLRKVAGLSSDGFLEAFRKALPRRDPEPHRSGMDRDPPRAARRPSLANTEAMTPPPGAEIPTELANHPDYTILRELGRGGMGVVYLAENKLLVRWEALKVVSSHLLDRPDVLDRFLAEIRSAARLEHPNVVTAYTALRLGERVVLAMQYVEGLDLARLVGSRGPFPVAHACYYIHQAALGLQHAYEHGMVHRDIKPSNLMLTRQGNRPVIKVLDFGLAKVRSEGPADRTLTLPSQILGTPEFIAPEQIRNARGADIRADIYSLGCTLYFLLTGGPPFQGACLYDILQAHHSVDAKPLNLVRPDVPVELAALVAKMMAKEPEQRFQEPKAVAQALIPFFKKGAAAVNSPGAESPRTVEMGSGRTLPGVVGSPTQPATNDGRPVVRPKTGAKPSAPEVQWGSLIDLAETRHSGVEMPAAAPGRKPAWRRPSVAAGVLLLGFLVTCGIVLWLRTPDGTIELANLPIDAKVLVDGNVVTVTSPGGGKPAVIAVAPGTHRIVVKKDGIEIAGDEVTVQAAGKEVFTVRLVPPPRDAPISLPIKPPPAPAEEPIPPPQLTEVARFIGHEGPVEASVAVSPDGRRILTGSGDHTLILWNRETAQPIRRLKGHIGRVLAVAISPDGRRALSGGEDSIVRLWDLDSGETIRELHGHTEWVFSVVFSPDGRLAYSSSGGFDRGGWQMGTDSAVRVWNLETGKEVRKLEGLAGIVRCLAVSPDGRRVLAGGYLTQEAIVWDAKTGTEVRRFREHHAGVEGVAFLPDGHRAVSSSFQDRMIRLWDVETGQELRRFQGVPGTVHVAVSPDGRWLLSSAWDSHDLRLWDVATGRCLQRIVWPSWAVRGSFTPDSTHAVWAGYDGILRMYRLTRTDPLPAPLPEPEPPDKPPALTNSIGMKLILIPAGEFLMGSADNALGAEADEKPRHRVRITRPFYLGTYEVTQAQYKAVMGKNPSYFSATGGGADRVGGQSTADYPVENVSWFDAILFCNKLSEKEGMKPFYEIEGVDVRGPDWNGPGYRLPTEAEWEYACRAGASTPTILELPDRAWFKGNSEDRTHPVGQKQANPFGLHDMHGNVWEWCWDWLQSEYYSRSPTDDPTGPEDTQHRVLRGGSIFDERLCRSADRRDNVPVQHNQDWGFRVARGAAARRETKTDRAGGTGASSLSTLDGRRKPRRN